MIVLMLMMVMVLEAVMMIMMMIVMKVPLVDTQTALKESNYSNLIAIWPVNYTGL